MAKAHTGHLTGSDAVISAAFRQFGITRVEGLDELLDVAAAFSRTKPPPKGKRQHKEGVCVYSISGGTGAHVADMCAAAGLSLCTLTPATQRQLHEWIPSYLRVSNPVDNGGAPSADWRGRKILDTIIADPNVSMLICPITGALPSMGNRLAKDLVDVAATTDKPIFVVWGSPVGNEVAYQQILLPSGVPVFRTFNNAVLAARAYFDFHRFQATFRSPFSRPVLRPSKVASQARQSLRQDEASSMRVLQAYGIPVPQHEVATSAREAAATADRIGFPVVAKICSPTILHKSGAGLVRVGLRDGREVRTAYRDFTAAAPDADGVIISEHIAGGTECVVGVAEDQLFGPVVMLGLGGVLVEVLGDVTFRIPPFGRADASAMINELKGAALLKRNRSDLHALVDVLMSVQQLALDLSQDVAELDINPLLVRSAGLGAVALDALVVPR
jgi:acyl-CoA synthetase (NDP forming)